MDFPPQYKNYWLDLARKEKQQTSNKKKEEIKKALNPIVAIINMLANRKKP